MVRITTRAKARWLPCAQKCKRPGEARTWSKCTRVRPGVGRTVTGCLTWVPRVIWKHTKIYIPHRGPYLVGQSMEKDLAASPGEALHWELTTFCRIQRTTNRVRVIPQVPSYDFYCISLHMAPESFIILQRAGAQIMLLRYIQWWWPEEAEMDRNEAFA